MKFRSIAVEGPIGVGKTSFVELLAKKINAEIDRLFPKSMEIIAEPGRFMVATAVTSIDDRVTPGNPSVRR